MGDVITVQDLGVMPYRDAWRLQEEAVQQAAAGGAETLFIVEHPPVVTLGRRDDSVKNLKTSPRDLERLGVELVHSDRGGDITYHGLGQIVAYPIIRLANHGFSVGGYVHWLEAIVIAVLAEMGIHAQTDPQAVGVWVADGGDVAKICAIGVRIRRGVSLHGLALNVSTDLSGFSHIIPCGLLNRGVTSIGKILATHSPPLATVKGILIRHLTAGLEASLNGRP
ncbi:MAG: lipoyl(octanoyl) transferase LipB [Tepidisphaeraceae bacterium]